MSFFLVIIVLIVLLAVWAVSLYNRLVRLRNGREQAFADIDVQLKQRHDMIPSLSKQCADICSMNVAF